MYHSGASPGISEGGFPVQEFFGFILTYQKEYKIEGGIYVTDFLPHLW